MSIKHLNRRQVVIGVGAGAAMFAIPGIARAQNIGGLLGLGDLLGRASDNALDQLAQPNAFFVKEAMLSPKQTRKK